jgi:hypothetical protein
MQCYCGCNRPAVTTYNGYHVCQECYNMANRGTKFILRVLGERKEMDLRTAVVKAHD